VWIALEGDQIAFLTGPGSCKARNLDRDPRVAISVTPHDYPFASAVIRGRVTEKIDGDRPGLSSTGSPASTPASPTPCAPAGSSS
jgi:hypothetical protein